MKRRDHQRTADAGTLELTDTGADDLDAKVSALERVLIAPMFARAPRLSALLRFITDETLAGRGKRLKAFVIAQAVFGRDQSFDASNDTIVRVEAGRMRRALELYYLTDGAEETLRIEVPKGGYRVGFYTCEPPGKNRSNEKNPYVAVLPLETAGDDPLETRVARGVVEALITNLTRIQGLAVMAHASAVWLNNKAIDVAQLRESGVTHLLSGYLEREEDSVRVTQHLVDLDSGATIWSTSRTRPLEGLLILEQGLANQVARALAIEIVSETADSSAPGTSDPLVLERFREGMLTMTPPSDPERITAAKQIFSRLIESNPDFPGAHAGLAFTLAVGRHSGAFEDPDQQLAIALDAAMQATEIDDAYGFGHGALSAIRAMLKQPKLAIAAAEKALQLNPRDAATLFSAGFAYQLAGRPDLAIRPIEEAQRLDPIEPRTPYPNTLGIAYLSCGLPERSLEYFERNRVRGGPAPVVQDLYSAVAHLMLGQKTQAKVYVEKLPQPLPDARSMVTYALGEDAKKVLKTLKELGLVDLAG